MKVYWVYFLEHIRITICQYTETHRQPQDKHRQILNQNVVSEIGMSRKK